MVGVSELNDDDSHIVLTLIVVGFLALAAVPGVAVADETLTDGGTYWQGQTLTYENGLSAGESVQVVTDPDGQHVLEVQADANGVATIQTANLDGDYRLERPDGTVLASFEVDVASLSVQPQSVSVESEGANAQTDLTLSSNRPSATVAIQSGSLSTGEIGNVFGSDTVTLDANGQATLSGDFTGVDPGNYDVPFEIDDATGSTEAHVEVTTPTTQNPGGMQVSTPQDVATVTRVDPGEQEGQQAQEQTQRVQTEPTPTARTRSGPTTPQRGFLSNGEGGPLSNVMNLTVLGFLLSAFGIVYQLMEGR